MREELRHSKAELAEELHAARENGVKPDREVVDRLQRQIEHRNDQLRRKMASYEALLKAGDHRAELVKAQAERDTELGLSRGGKRRFGSAVDKQLAKWREELAGHQRAAHSDLVEEAQRRLEEDKAALAAAVAHRNTVQREVYETLHTETQVAGGEYIRAYDDGLLDWTTANERFDERRGPVSKDAAVARRELREMLGVREAESARLEELLWSGDEVSRKLAASEIASRSLGKDAKGNYKNAYYTQEQLDEVVGTRAGGRWVSANMLCGQGKSVSALIWGFGKAVEVAPEGLVARVTTSRSFLASKGFTDFLKATAEHDYRVDVHYIKDADTPLAAPREGRATLYVMDTDTEAFLDVKGNGPHGQGVPKGPNLDDEGDESKIWIGGGEIVGGRYQISDGAAREARDEVAAPRNSAAKFLADKVASKDLTPAHFGVDPKGYGKVDVTDQGRATIHQLLTEQGIHDIGVDDVTRAAVAEYQFRRGIDYDVGDVVVNGVPTRAVLLINRVTGKVLTDFETNNDQRITNGIHQALEAKENLVETAAGRPGLKIRHDVDGEKHLTTKDYINEHRQDDQIALISGTNTESSELLAENYPRLGPVVRIERVNNTEADVNDHGTVMFDDQAAKRAWVAEKIKSLHDTGQPVLYGADRNDKPGELSKLLTEMGIPHDVVGDFNYQVAHRANWEADMEAHIREKSGHKGAVTLVSQMGGRGNDYRVSAEVKRLSALPPEEKQMHGIYLIGDGDSPITSVINKQRDYRVGRADDPGERILVLSRDDDVFAQIHDPNIQLAITHYQSAAQAHTDAAADPRQWKTADLQTLQHNRDTAAHKLLEQIPKIQQITQHNLTTPHTFSTPPTPARHTPPSTLPAEGQLNLSTQPTPARAPPTDTPAPTVSDPEAQSGTAGPPSKTPDTGRAATPEPGPTPTPARFIGSHPERRPANPHNRSASGT